MTRSKGVLCPQCGKELQLAFLYSGVCRPKKCGFKVDRTTLEEFISIRTTLKIQLQSTLTAYMKRIYDERNGDVIVKTKRSENQTISTD